MQPSECATPYVDVEDIALRPRPQCPHCLHGERIHVDSVDRLQRTRLVDPHGESYTPMGGS